MLPWIIPKDLRHLKNYAEIVAAILESESACLAHWIPYLSHRDCQARSHMERLSYFLNNPAISDEVLYVPLLKQFLKEWTGQELILVMDTSMFWDTYCLIEVCVAWGGRSLTLAQKHKQHRVFELYWCRILISVDFDEPLQQILSKLFWLSRIN
jgi:hypothetical protein